MSAQGRPEASGVSGGPGGAPILVQWRNTQMSYEVFVHFTEPLAEQVAPWRGADLGDPMES